MELHRAGREYLAYFLHRHLDFRLPELESLIDFEEREISYTWRKPFGETLYSPFWYLRLPSDDTAKKLCNRVLLLKVSVLLPSTTSLQLQAGEMPRHTLLHHASAL